MTLNKTAGAHRGRRCSRSRTRTELFQNQDADVEVSTDGGVDVAVRLHAEHRRQHGFVQRTVSLGSFAKKQILLRFRVQYAGGSVFIFDPEGWYIDDIVDRQRAGRRRPGHERRPRRDRVLVHADPAGRVRPAGPSQLPREWVRRLEQREAGLDLPGEQRSRRRSTHRSSRGRPPAPRRGPARPR